MAESKAEVTTPLFQNILDQPEAVRAVALHQLGEGRRDLLRAAELIQSAERVVFTGMGASLFACLPAFGTTATVIEAAELLYFQEARLLPNTLVVLVSRSGESIELVKLLDILERRRCKTLGITNVEGSSLDTRTTARILLNSPSDQLVAIQTYQATLLALALLSAVCVGELDRATEEFQTTADSFAEYVQSCVTESENWHGFASLSAPLYVLGRGPSQGSVSEGVLLMHEAGKTPAIGMSGAQFRHGPVEVTDRNFRAVILGTQDATHAIDQALAEDLQKMGGQIRWIGPASPVKSLGDWPERLSDRFTPLFEVVPFQLLAYRTAEVYGLVPGDFRWAPLVTNTEAGFPGLAKP